MNRRTIWLSTLVVTGGLGAATACGGGGFTPATGGDASADDATVDSSVADVAAPDGSADATPDATTPDATTPDATTPDAGAGCRIDGTTYADTERNPANPCQECRVLMSKSQWSNTPDGASCGDDGGPLVCHAGACSSGCYIDAAYAAAGASNPANPCQSCQPDVSLVAWSPAAEGTSCGGTAVCVDGGCSTQCDIDGGVYAPGASNPTNACQTCQPSMSTGGWTTASGLSCAAADGGVSCVNTVIDPNNCGSCGNVCAPGATCVASSCFPPFPSTGSDGAFAPTANVTLAPGIYNYTTIHVPAGVTVTVSGNGILDLRATGAIEIDGAIDVSGGAGGNVAVNAATGGSGGDTGTTLTATMGAAGIGGGGDPGGAPTATADGGAPGTAGGGVYGGGAGAKAGCGGGGGGYSGGAGGDWLNGNCAGGTGSGGATSSAGGNSGSALYNGSSGENQGPGMTGGGGGGIGFLAATDLPMATTFRTGSGGGGGTGNGSLIGAGGGGGGGALRLASPVTITVSGNLFANGGAGGNAISLVSLGVAGCATTGGGGGGGSGGAIYLASPTVAIESTAFVTAKGGAGGTACPAVGGAGGLGRVRFSMGDASCTLAGTIIPAPVNRCVPVAATAGNAYVGAYPN